MTQPPHPSGPQNSGWQQQPPPGSWDGRGYAPGFEPRGPRRSRTTLYVVLAAAGVIVLLGVVALVLPGLMGGDDDQGSGPTAPSPAAARPAGSPQPAAQQSETPGGPRLTEATTLATRFLTFLNANDQKHATALGCADSKNLLAGQLLVMVDPPTRLTVSGPAASVTSYYPRISVPFSGTTKGGAPLAGTVDIMDSPSLPLCVRLTSLAP
ncbi:hypothetical protein ACIA58_06375 [Kribbella sp. NPDC051586]|uniref:hypothetical protein n=1 Tax=Kribbella sp. NPDC051586 TaxID=3364118 RepID=UPI0037940520